MKNNFNLQVQDCEKYHPKEKGESKIEEVKPMKKTSTVKVEEKDGVIQLGSDDEDFDDLILSKFSNKSEDGAM